MVFPKQTVNKTVLPLDLEPHSIYVIEDNTFGFALFGPVFRL